MITYIVCEGNFDAQLLKIAIPEKLLNDVEVVAAGGGYAINSLARSLVVRRQVPVMIVVDADSVEPELVQQRLKDIEEIVGGVAANTPVKVVMAVPEIEIIFFQDVSLLSRLLGYIPPKDILDMAVYQPRKALEQLISRSEIIHNSSEIIDRLTKEEIEILRSSSVMQEIAHFLQSVRETANAV
ncbi:MULTISPECIES: hypothetical protein [unclassified Microcoleus]|uniref:hypothetical protein n=1 Tax=unclassified Microcoleus TaxID=2642155 RepID=UPI0025DE6CD3|nr:MULTISPECIES: hypothetical protein [unclassified Microcoleus]